jgi:hypothetical protein
MALRQIRIGGMDNVSQYDDGDYDKSISVEDPIECTAPPVAANDVLRLADVGTSVGDVFGPAGATDSNIAEFNGVTGKLLKDGGLSHATVAGAVGSSHARSHAISSTSDHSDVNLAGLSNNDLMRWDDPSSKWLPKSIAEVVSGNNINPAGVEVSGYFITAVVETTSGAAPALTSADFGKTHIYSDASASPTYNLPSVAAGDVGATIEFIKTGTGTITIDAADSDTIEDSGAGDTIYSSDTTMVSIKLQLVTATQWKIISATGTWTTTD